MQLLRWLEIDRFDRREVNRRLTEHVVVADIRSAA